MRRAPDRKESVGKNLFASSASGQLGNRGSSGLRVMAVSLKHKPLASYWLLYGNQQGCPAESDFNCSCFPKKAPPKVPKIWRNICEPVEEPFVRHAARCSRLASFLFRTPAGIGQCGVLISSRCWGASHRLAEPPAPLVRWPLSKLG